MMARLRFGVILIAMNLLMLVSGCGETLEKIGQVIEDPSIQVGEDEEQPSEIALHAYAAADVNPNADGQPAPIVVKLFALSSDHRLYSYDFFSLVDDPEKTLGVTMIEYLDENMLEPDSYVILGPYELPPRTKRIGVIAEFNDIEATTWRSSIAVDAIGADDRLLMLLLEEEVRLIAEEG